jgi:hypothetical protein
VTCTECRHRDAQHEVLAARIDVGSWSSPADSTDNPKLCSPCRTEREASGRLELVTRAIGGTR